MTSRCLGVIFHVEILPEKFLLLSPVILRGDYRRKIKRPIMKMGRFGYKSLTMTYFHTGIRTIIGAEAFHCPVRDGKEWDQLAMVVRHNLLPG